MTLEELRRRARERANVSDEELQAAYDWMVEECMKIYEEAAAREARVIEVCIAQMIAMSKARRT